ncbi:MAG TPA: hypothetical protein VFT51_03630 [Bacillales bacterium]|nr:hypothetical protein [Bacillales bacterium]
MLGAIFSDKEIQELEYVLKREMEELLLDLGDERIEGIVKRSMEERYQMIFRLFSRFAVPSECSRYVRSFSNQNPV